MTTRRASYLILTHTDPLQLRRLINALDYEADFYIHVDLKVNMLSFLVLELPNSAHYYVENRLKVFWSGFRMVRAT